MKLWLAVILALSTTGSWAALGSTVSVGPRAFAAQTHAGSTGQAVYTDVEKKLESGTVVHEYADAQGTVFAVSWSGPYLPDLKEVLGDHFKSLVEHAGRAARGGRPGISVKRADLVIISDGHMGAFKGRAWLPAKLPAGFGPGDIK